MGVPRLFPWIKYFFPKAVREFVNRGETLENVDYLYLDGNALIHAATQQVYNYGAGKSPVDRFRDLSKRDRQLKAFESFFDLICDVVKMITPSKVLYLAIDGPAPSAKQYQQRQRRFSGAADRKDMEFDPNSITPGTLFMHELTKYLNFAIRERMMKDVTWQKLTVHFSSVRIPGEGEHKILDFIRSLSYSERDNFRHCIMSPDGDLIMLCLAAHLPKMFLLREDQDSRGLYYFMDMSMITNGMKSVLFFDKSKRTPADMVNDFILMGFFVGNDFLPKIRMFLLLEEGLDAMAYAYRDSSNNGLREDSYLTRGDRVLHKGFLKFLQRLSNDEIKYLTDQSKKQMPDPKFINHTLLNCMKDGKLDFLEYRKKYYLKEGISEKKDIQRMCADYLRSFFWIFKYYLHGLPSWTWYYSWHYPPLMIDMVEYVQGLSEKEFISLQTFHQVGDPAYPFIQLLSVLPPSSRYLLPSEFHFLFDDSSPLAKAGYFASFTVDLEGVWKEHMGISMINFVNIDLVREEYFKVKMNAVYVRNLFDVEKKFVYDSSFKGFTHVSDYGKIRDIRVRRQSVSYKFRKLFFSSMRPVLSMVMEKLSERSFGRLERLLKGKETDDDSLFRQLAEEEEKKIEDTAFSSGKLMGFLTEFSAELKVSSKSTILDFGGATGIAAKTAAEKFGIKEIYVADVHEPSFVVPGVNYVQLKEGKLPFENGKFDIVATMMTLHHIERQERVISELHRISNRWLLIQEHDCIEDYPFLLDIVHGMYIFVKKDQDYDKLKSFEQYRAWYRSAVRWNELLKGKFVLRRFKRTKNAQRNYFALYEKTTTGEFRDIESEL